jgi:transcriptional regulator with XRE-family HTH domain
VGESEIKAGTRVRAARKHFGLSLERLSNDTGISISGLSRIERGEQRLREDEVERIAGAFGLSLADYYQLDFEQSAA